MVALAQWQSYTIVIEFGGNSYLPIRVEIATQSVIGPACDRAPAYSSRKLRICRRPPQEPPGAHNRLHRCEKRLASDWDWQDCSLLGSAAEAAAGWRKRVTKTAAPQSS
jgi:hypothetical protein